MYTFATITSEVTRTAPTSQLNPILTWDLDRKGQKILNMWPQEWSQEVLSIAFLEKLLNVSLHGTWWEGQRELLSLHFWPHGARSVRLFDFIGTSVIITNFHLCKFEIKPYSFKSVHPFDFIVTSLISTNFSTFWKQCMQRENCGHQIYFFFKDLWMDQLFFTLASCHLCQLMICTWQQ